MKKRLLMFFGVILVLTIWAQGKVATYGETVSKVDSDEFTYSGSLRDYTLYVSECGAYYVTDLAGNMLLNVTYTFDLNQMPRPWTYYYSYDNERVELYHTWKVPGSGTGYGDTIRLSDTGFIIHCVNDAWINVYLRNSHYGVEMPAGTKLVSDGENVTVMAEEGVKKEVYTRFYEFVTDITPYEIAFSTDFDTIGSSFHFADGILTYSLSKEQDITIEAIKPGMDHYEFTHIKNTASGTIDLNSEDIIWYATEKEALKAGRKSDANEDTKKTVTLSWKKLPTAARYVVYKKTAGGYVKTATVKKNRYTASVTEDTVFKIKAQKKVKDRWKTIKTYHKKINF